MFLHAGVPKFFRPYISPQQSIYNTRISQNLGSFLFVPKFHSSSHTSFGHSFAFDAPTLWNSLPDDVHGSATLWSFRIKLIKAFLFTKTYPPYALSYWLSAWCQLQIVPGYPFCFMLLFSAPQSLLCQQRLSAITVLIRIRISKLHCLSSGQNWIFYIFLLSMNLIFQGIPESRSIKSKAMPKFEKFIIIIIFMNKNFFYYDIKCLILFSV